MVLLCVVCLLCVVNVHEIHCGCMFKYEVTLWVYFGIVGVKIIHSQCVFYTYYGTPTLHIQEHPHNVALVGMCVCVVGVCVVGVLRHCGGTPRMKHFKTV